MLNLFIPKIKIIQSITTCSVPYKCKNGADLYLGDIIEVNIPNVDDDMLDGFKENYVVTFSEGRIVGATYVDNIYVELHELPSKTITNLGSGFNNPELLNLLTK